MKIQSLAVIFAIIVLPIAIVLSYYLSYQIETISLQTSYDTKLINATYDAMASLELNTANEDLSNVADSLRSIIDASTSTFFNTLATNLGMSNASTSYVQPYIPAILYTLYDGYYIYSPTRVTTVLTDSSGDNIVYVGDRGVTCTGYITVGSTNIGIYTFNSDEYDKESNASTAESQTVKNSRQNTLLSTLEGYGISYEYGQMLYENEDGTYSVTINDNTKYTEDYILKSYMPYTARYTGTTGSTSYDLTINYTLDNYLSIEGSIGDVYYSKTGYLIGANIVQGVTVNGDAGVGSDWLTYNEQTVEDMCLSGQYNLEISIQPYDENGNQLSSALTISYNTYQDSDGNLLSSTELEEYLDKLYENQDANLTEIQNIESSLANLKAITYYLRSQIFSNWVYDNLGSGRDSLTSAGASKLAIKVKDININGTMQSQMESMYSTELSTSDTDLTTIIQDFSGNTSVIFDYTVNPEKEDSVFYEHKMEVMRNSIQYNLNLALSSYDVMASSMDIEMPVISDTEWDSILSRVTVVAFMQGLNCGLKTYNNYAVVSSTNNELTVIPDEIYYVPKSEYNDTNSYYHRIDCLELVDDVNGDGSVDSNDEYISFKSKEVKYDKIYDSTSSRYVYDHRNLACYSCISGANYLKRTNANTESTATYGYSDKILISSLGNNKKRAYFIAVAKERQNLYKTNALTDSNGYESVYYGSGKSVSSSSGLSFGFSGDSKGKASARYISEMREIEVTISNVTCSEPDAAKVVATVNFLSGSNTYISVENVTLNLQSTAQTLTLSVHESYNQKIDTISFDVTDPSGAEVSFDILNIRVIYE